MNKSDFLERIQSSPLLSEEHRTYVLGQVDNLTPELMQEIADSLGKHEQMFLDAVSEKEQAKAREEFLDLMRRQEESHQRDLAEADRLLAEIMNS